MPCNVSFRVEHTTQVKEHVESDLYTSASKLTSLKVKADIANGLVDVNAGRVEAINVSEFKVKGSAKKSDSLKPYAQRSSSP